MKKLIVLMCFALFLTGCSKNYKTVNEYKIEMDKIKASNNSYTYEVKIASLEANAYQKISLKDKKWKAETSLNEGAFYAETLLFNGEELLQYKGNNGLAVTVPNFNMEENDNNFNSMLNPAGALYEWSKPMFGFTFDNVQSVEFVNQKEEKNNFPCRMIKYVYQSGSTKEVCVNDEYGIAVYLKEISKSTKPEQKDAVMEFNVVKVNTDEIDDSQFELPSGVKRMSFDDLMGELGKLSETLKGSFDN